LKAIFDEGVPEVLAALLTGHEVTSVGAEGWKSVKNGKLLDLIEAAGFAAFITNDKRMEKEQALDRRRFATLILRVPNWEIIRERVADIEVALDAAQPGKVTTVDCGFFVPRRMRNPGSLAD
jgi:hypothetical protein